MNDAPLATQIKEARRTLGLSQTQAADAWGVPVKTLQKWEQGIREPQGLALDALRQKLAEAISGHASAGPTPQDEPPGAVPAPAAQSDDATLDTLAQADPAPQDSAPVASPANHAMVAAPQAAAAVEDDGSGWLPFVSVAHSHARYKEWLKSMPPAASEGVGW